MSIWEIASLEKCIFGVRLTNQFFVSAGFIPWKTPKDELCKKINAYIFNAKLFVLSLLSSCDFVIRRRSSFYFFCVECPKGHPYYIGDVSILWGTSKRALHGVADDIRNLVTSFLMTIRRTFMYISFAFSCKVVPNFSNCSWDWRGLHLNQIYTFSLHFCWLNFLVEFFRWFVFLFHLRDEVIYWLQKLCISIAWIFIQKQLELVSFQRIFFRRSLYTSVVGSVQTNLMFFCSILSFFFTHLLL